MLSLIFSEKKFTALRFNGRNDLMKNSQLNLIQIFKNFVNPLKKTLMSLEFLLNFV